MLKGSPIGQMSKAWRLRRDHGGTPIDSGHPGAVVPITGWTLRELPGVQPRKRPPQLSMHSSRVAQICGSVNSAKRRVFRCRGSGLRVTRAVVSTVGAIPPLGRMTLRGSRCWPSGIHRGRQRAMAGGGCVRFPPETGPTTRSIGRSYTPKMCLNEAIGALIRSRLRITRPLVLILVTDVAGR